MTQESTQLAKLLNLTKALIFRITHIDNMSWIFDHGLHCCNSDTRDPNYIEIGNPELIAKREHRQVPVPPHGTLSDYIPFYFTPHSPMLLNIKTGYAGMKQTPMSEIVIMVSSLRTLVESEILFVFTDRHAYLETARDGFSSDLKDLDRIDWKLLQARDFKKTPENPENFERYQAEALVYKYLPVTALRGVVCYDSIQQSRLEKETGGQLLDLKIVTRPEWYF